MSHIENHIIPSTCHNKTVKYYLEHRCQLSSAQIRSLKFHPNGICVNAQHVRITHILQENDHLRLSFPEKASSHILPSNTLPEILYESDSVICIHKPSGVPTHPTGGHYRDSAANMLQYYYRKNRIQCTLHCIGRLDIDTDGILLFAKNKVAASRLWKQRTEHILSKEYLAICEGTFSQQEHREEQIIQNPLIKIQDHPLKMAVHPQGLEAITYYQALPAASDHLCQNIARMGFDCTPVRVRITTGRTHQIRVHMASIGHPIIGDPLYGNNAPKIPEASHTLLYVQNIHFIDPSTNQSVVVSRI